MGFVKDTVYELFFSWMLCQNVGNASFIPLKPNSELESTIENSVMMDLPKVSRLPLTQNWQEEILGENFDSPYQIEIKNGTTENKSRKGVLPYQVRQNGEELKIQFKINYIRTLKPDEMELFMEYLKNVQNLDKVETYKNFGSIPLDRKDLYGRKLHVSPKRVGGWENLWNEALKYESREVIDFRTK